jgi:hypothetical protein
MNDLETKIAEARERIVERELSDPHEIFDAAVAFMREAQPRKVTDAQRGWIARILVEKRMSVVTDADLISEICAVFESTDEPAAKDAEIARLEARVRALETNTICRSPAR